MSCHICKKTGIRECGPAAAEIKCMICGRCEAEAEAEREAREGKRFEPEDKND